jgi:DNA-binding XRE family transcriptional regulator
MFQFKNLGNYREQKLVSRAEMARKTGLSPLTINKLEDGRACRPDTAKKILESLDIFISGSDFVYDEKQNDAVVYTSPFVRSASAQLILKRVPEDDDAEVEPSKPRSQPPKSAVKKKSIEPAKSAAKKTAPVVKTKLKPKPKTAR